MSRLTSRHAVVVLAVLWIVTLAGWGVDHFRAWLDRGSFNRTRQTLLYDVDHAVIRDECRRLLAEARGTADGPSSATRPMTRPRPRGGEVRPPPALAVFKPSIVLVDADGRQVKIMFGGGFHHWFLLYFEDAKAGRGTKDLGGGLWFEDEAGQVPSGP